VQVRILPVSDDHRAAAEAVRDRLKEAGIRAEVDDRSETVGKRIRDAELQKIPRVVVYGDRESPESLAVRERGGGQSTKSLDELIAELGTM
jgi:threonyl-tRNA synthetase